MTSALDVLLKQRRFDLIFKYLYVKNPSEYNCRAYLENIRAFNGGYEMEPSDGIPKESLEDFIVSYDRLVASIKVNGFDSVNGSIPVQENGEISDGAHRLSACAALGVNISLIPDHINNDVYSYRYFELRKMDKRMMDYGALEYVKLNPNAHIVNLQSVVNPNRDDAVIKILEKYGFVYYKKNVYLSFNGYVNLKKISYGLFWERESWIGDASNCYAGAVMHAKLSQGRYPCRVLVFVCNDIEKVIQAKSEIRELYGIGNYSVHINDTHDEAVWLAETYFNDNSLFWLNNTPYKFSDVKFDENIEYLKKCITIGQTNIDDFCCVGSSPLNAFGIRHADDVDYITTSNFHSEDSIISPHDDQLRYYPASKEEMITNPDNYFYYHGVKVYSLRNALRMKLKRGERKDIRDSIHILSILLYSPKQALNRHVINFKDNLKKQKWLTQLYLFIKRKIKFS